MQALTIWQPWAWAIGAGLKLVENRDWLPRAHQLMPGDDFAIHAAVRPVSREDYATMRHYARLSRPSAEVPPMSSHCFGATYGLGRVVAIATFAGIARRREDLPEEQRPWFVGKYGWVLKNVRQLNLGSAPAVRGQQGLWVLHGDAERIISAQLVQPEGQLWRRTAP